MLKQPEFWILLGFIIFVLLTYQSVRKMVSRLLDNKINKISHEIESIKLQKIEIETQLAEYEDKKNNILNDIEKIKLNSEKEIKAIKERYETELSKYLANKSKTAITKINSFESSVIKNLQNNAIEQISELIEKIIKDKIDQKTATKLLDDAVSDLEKKSLTTDYNSKS